MLNRIRRLLSPDRPPADPLERLLAPIRKLRPGQIAIDCGANVGNVTAVMAATGATVHAFEPNPAAFAVLSARVAELPNVKAYQAAVAASAGTVRLYRHIRAQEDAVYWSVGSSTIVEKNNIDHAAFDDVPAVDLAEFIGRLGRPVDLLKMDIEGAEVALLNHLIDMEIVTSIGIILVETHEDKIPHLREPTELLRRTIAERGLDNIRLDWI